MKKYLFTVLFISIVFNLFSQDEKPIEKGNFLIGGNFSTGFYSRKTDYGSTSERSNSFNLSMSPSFGYFLTNGLAIGAEIPLNLNAVNSDTEEESNTSYGIGIKPFVKYYFKFGLLLELSGEYDITQYEINNNSLQTDTKIYSVVSGIGYSFFINSKVSLEPKLNYSYSHWKYVYKSETLGETETKYWDNDLYVSIGLQVFL